jgi:UDP-N-acetylglucosamine--N-acetylmuramyl-(pentapeptide) pyrophosphoryl-undecaprenol N-acetylglucosamine transferase
MTGTILIAAGGTGGHLYPAIAVADAIRERHPDIRLVFVGTDRIESREVPRAGYEFHQINIQAPGKSFGSLATFPFQLSKAVLDAMKLMSRERPMAMLSAGAYLSVPVGIAAWSFHVPIALLEINSIAGTANKFLARLAQKLFVAYPESLTSFPSSIRSEATVSGTPVRGSFGQEVRSSAEARAALGLDPARPMIFVFGGSLGARAINQAMPQVARACSSRGYSVLWQTGKGNATEDLQREFANDPHVQVQEYIYDMETAYAAADLVVCRAGASSLAELARFGKPAVLVPYPHATANHQEANAKAFEAEGAAIVIRDSELNTRLEPEILELMSAPDRLQRMSQAMKSREHADAAEQVAEWLIAQGVRRESMRSQQTAPSV